jgi:hypothetical protein
MTIKLTRLDLDYILTQIQMAEAGQTPVNPILAFGLREVNGNNNNLSAGGTTFGSSFQPFPTLTTPLIRTHSPARPILRPTAWSSTRSRARSACWSQARTPITRRHDRRIKSRRLVDGILGTPDDVFVNGNAAAFAAAEGSWPARPGLSELHIAWTGRHLRHRG